jgi:hypothetical protein
VQVLISLGAAKRKILERPFAVSFHLLRTFRNLVVDEFYLDSEAGVLGIFYEQREQLIPFLFQRFAFLLLIGRSFQHVVTSFAISSWHGKVDSIVAA